MAFQIRLATPADCAAVSAFNVAMAHETEAVSLDTATTTAGVAAVLVDPSLGFFVVAQSNTETIAAMLVTYEWSDWRNASYWWMQSVYVMPSHRNQGVYKALYAHVKALARHNGNVCGFRLYVERNNTRAKNVYVALGMHDSHYDLYEETL